MRDVWIFVVVALGSAWLIALPPWLDGGNLAAHMPFAGMAMMFAPTLAVLVVWLVNGRPAGLARETGLLLGERKGRTVGLLFAGWFAPPLLSAVAVALSAALGLLTLDIGGFSLVRQQIPAGMPIDAGSLVVLQLVLSVFLAPLLNAVPAFAEEWGWRGWLLPKLLPLGMWPAMLLSGVIWGVWHAPLTLLGYNYPELGAGAALMTVGFCVLSGALIGWLRLRSGSVWPAALAHGSVNATAGWPVLLGSAQEPPNMVVSGLVGLVGWAVLAAVIAVVFRLRPLPQASAASDNLQVGAIERSR
ncbi:CPBP family intramembrane glutamic endopeptidase [Saccharopolyspora taberi]|uniref:CPBP family intramembrane metalloprotease n=1 Tax=Saccharopolyspora taberi TaxID=60895 RepID=A0ABN3V5X0_9PSEU